ncbi:hypothetical protein [Arthrobacter sp. AZCC_0090]|uniref:TlpA family protein disulfide reductase n=1 Tax=Arthrobacter sp. AZCC_0090 TaxID=2735881 RepID=UPI0016115474|nr:hypothetical protein [Arthrobacter sp. AZCC_0090]MBB6405673.1 thiol-disulfide isomerase/thioredoxin [Arthrobacter sp. AZCC_0090]
MILLSVALLVTALIAVVNLVFTLAVVRRLREHESKLGDISTKSAATDLMVKPGEAPANFDSLTIAGERLSTASLGAGTLIGFFLKGCAPCSELFPDFVKAVREYGGNSRPIAVLAGFSDEDNDYVAALSEFAHVVFENQSDTSDTLTKAFKVSAYPSVCTMDAAGCVSSTDKRIVLAPTLTVG